MSLVLLSNGIKDQFQEEQFHFDEAHMLREFGVYSLIKESGLLEGGGLLAKNSVGRIT